MAKELEVKIPQPDAIVGLISGPKSRVIDEAGNRYGRLVVVGRAEGSGRARWKCLCDCGEYAEVSGTNLRQGMQKSCGCLRVESAKRLHPMFGEDHPCWKGTRASYAGLHAWVRRYKPKTGICTSCGREGYTECANISGEYLRDIDDYAELCKRCHVEFDRICP